MKYKKPFIALGSIVFILVVAGIFAVLLVTHRFDYIDHRSVFRVLVDKEIRNVPVAQGTSDFYFQSYPTDGTSRGRDVVKIKSDGKNDFYDQAVAYFMKLGYAFEKNSSYRLSRGEDEITIEQRENYLEISKFF